MSKQQLEIESLFIFEVSILTKGVSFDKTDTSFSISIPKEQSDIETELLCLSELSVLTNLNA